MVENSEDTLEQRKLIQIAGTMSDTLAPEVLFEILKVSTSEDMLKMAVGQCNVFFCKFIKKVKSIN